MSKIQVILPEKDWMDLVNFVRGDLANMPEDDTVRIQMDGISKQIIEAIAIHNYWANRRKITRKNLSEQSATSCLETGSGRVSEDALSAPTFKHYAGCPANEGKPVCTCGTGRAS